MLAIGDGFIVGLTQEGRVEIYGAKEAKFDEEVVKITARDQTVFALT